MIDLVLQYSLFLSALSATRLYAATTGAGFSSAAVLAQRYRTAFMQLVRTTLTEQGAAEIVSELDRITRDNTAQVLASLRAGQIKALGAIGELATKAAQLTPDSFTTKDKRGRSWQSVRFVTLLIRTYLMNREVDRVIADAVARGVSSFTVHNPKIGHRFDGLVLSLDELMARRAEIFHPGSLSTLTLNG